MSDGYNLVYMGTPDFAVAPLEALVRAGHRVQLVLTQPDRPAGRGGKLRASPVKVRAEELGLSLCQPTTLRGEEGAEARAQIEALQPDAIVVAAYGLILPQSVLDIPKLGAVNIHASLLPRWRGASPIQAAIRAGDARTGVTIMKMDAGLDTGPMALREEVAIMGETTAGKLHDALAQMGADLVVAFFQDAPRYLREAVLQPEEGSTYAPMLKKSDGRINWAMTAEALHNHIRAMTPWPGAQTAFEGLSLRIVTSSVVTDGASPENASTPAPPGTVVRMEGESGLVETGAGRLQIDEIQPAGKRPMTFARFLQGRRLELPLQFGFQD